MSAATTTTTTTQQERLRERLAAVKDAWRPLDQTIGDALGDVDWRRETPDWWRALARRQQRMADAIELLEREWVLRHQGQGGR